MLGFLRFLVRRLALMLLTLIVLTAVLYGILMLAPVEARVELYESRGRGRGVDPAIIIRRHHLDDPYPVQYGYWLYNLLRGDWGYSPTLNEAVLPALLRRTAVTAELTLYCALFFIPLGLFCGVVAGWRQGRRGDKLFRVTAYVATSVPTFIMAILFIAVFYVGLNWFPTGRLSVPTEMVVRSASSSFRSYTGLVTLDGLLNGRLDVTLDALRHLVLPVLTISLAHWATIGRLARTSIIEELGQEYMVAARGRGLSERQALWRHALRNALVPPLNSTAFSVASLLTGIFVVEAIFDLRGVSGALGLVAISRAYSVPDIPATMGFSVYVVLLVLPLMLILDLLQAAIDPRLRGEALQ